MDSNAEPATTIDNAIDDSSVSSLTSSFDQLKMNGDSPINLLPNEMIQQIVARVRTDGWLRGSDVKYLIRLRLVSTRWLSIVDGYCQQKKSLNVNGVIPSFSSLTVESNNPAPLHVCVRNLKYIGSMLKQFPNIERLKLSLHLHNWDSRLDDLIRAVAPSIDSLSSLKHLELEGQFVKVVPLLSQTLSKLKFFRFAEFRSILTEQELLQMVGRLGADCVGFDLASNATRVDYCLVRGWHQANPNWLANLTHFRMHLGKERQMNSKVVHFLCEHATSLTHLNICAVHNKPFVLTPSVIHHLSKLNHLTELNVWFITMDIAELEQAAAQQPLTSVTSVLTCYLRVIDGRGTVASAGQFMRVLSDIFPNLTSFKLCLDGGYSSDRQFLNEIQQNWYRFRNLRQRGLYVA